LDILREHGATATELAAAMSWLDAEHERWVEVALADFASGSSTI
jgi:peptidoglycan/xylan/chitin deacetylase (PgdA/CDA1 family)